jgi:hypothetical protein
MTTFESAKTWSLVDNKPIVCYVKATDDYIVYWNGYFMSHSSALCVMLEKFGAYFGQGVRLEVEKEFADMHCRGSFNVTDLSIGDSNTITNYHKKVCEKAAEELAKKYTINEVFGWFDYAKAIVIDEYLFSTEV